MESEQHLVTKARAGDQAAFAGLVRIYRDSVLRLAYMHLGNYEEAVDASQDIFIKALRSIGRFAGRSGFSTWLHRIAVNHCHDILRKRKRSPEIMSPTDIQKISETSGVFDIAHTSEIAELRSILQKAMLVLSDNQHTAITMRYFGGYSTREIADLLDCDPNTVRTHIFRALEKLKTRIDKNMVD